MALPFVEPSNPVKLALRRALGRIACVLLPGKARALSAGEGPASFGLVDRLMLAALRQRAEREGTLEEFTARQQRRFWSSGAAADFHSTQEQYFEEWFLGHNRALLEELEKAVAEGSYGTLCEIGCGTGLALVELRRRLPGINRFVGIDLSEEQIRRNRTRFADDRLEWVAGDALAWILAGGGPGWVFLSNNGVLEYFTRDDVQKLFGHLASRLRPTLISLCEPVGMEHDLDGDSGSSPYGTERSFSHNYPHLLREAGFDVLYESEIRRSGHRLLRILARAG